MWFTIENNSIDVILDLNQVIYLETQQFFWRS